MGRRGGREGGGRGGNLRKSDRPGGARDDRGMRDRRPDDRGTRDRRPEDRGVRDRRPDDVGMRDRRPDDVGMRDRRPDYRTRRSPRRSPFPDRRPHRSPRGPSPDRRLRGRSPLPDGRLRRSPSPDRRLRRSPSPDRRLRRSPSPDHRARRPRDDDSQLDLPRKGQADYGRVPYRQERDRYDHPGRHDGGPNGSYDDRGLSRRFDSRAVSGRSDGPPDYMLPEHPSNLGRAAEKESSFFGGPGGRSINKDNEFYGDAGTGMSLRVSSTGMGRTSSLYLDRRSPCLLPPPPAISPPPRALYPSVPPTETGFLTGGATMNSGESFGAGNNRLWHDDSGFQYHDHLRGSYGSREIERPDPGRDVLIDRDAEKDKLYCSRGMFDSDIAPSMQLNGYVGSSSSLLTKDRPYRVHGAGYGLSNGYIMDDPGRPPHESLGHGGGHAYRLSERSLEHSSGHDNKILLEITRQTHSKHPPRTASMEYDADGYGRRVPENETYLASGNLYGNDSRDSRASISHTLGSSPLTGLKDERSNHQVRLSRRMAEDEDYMEYNAQHSYHGDTPVCYREAKVSHVRYSRSPENDPLDTARRLVRRHEFTSFEDDRELSDQVVSPIAYRRASRGAAYSDHDMDFYQGDRPPGREYYNDDFDAYDLSPERMSRRSYDYDYDDDDDGYNARYDMPTSRNVFSRIALPSTTDEELIDADEGNHPRLNTLARGRSKYKPISQRLSRSMVERLEPQFGGSAMLVNGRGGWTKSAKKRLRAGLPQNHGGNTSERNEFVSPNKILKLSEDNRDGTESNHEDAPNEEEQKDPPEGSEEFSKQVHQAFLKFSKILNETPDMQKRYREAQKGSLCCCVCGSVPRKFPDIDALMSHAYDTRKPGLKTKHLGFHKALCVLMGWNWHVAPDTSKAYQSVPAEEVNAMKRDLMLWPPVVVIHNSSIMNKVKSTEAKIVSKDEIEGVLTDIGVAFNKVKISHGRPANQSVFLVKFQPTISGFKEAMRIDEHFTAENHGKEEFLQIKGGKGKNAAPIDKLEELLYAHIAVAEDLRYLDDETKKRCVIRSMNDTEAMADATLNLDS